MNRYELVMAQSQFINELLSSMPVWRSMDSAPKDGKHVLLAVKTGPFVYTVEGYYYEGEWLNAAEIEGETLAWMPKVKIPNQFLPWTEEYKMENGNA